MSGPGTRGRRRGRSLGAIAALFGLATIAGLLLRLAAWSAVTERSAPRRRA